MQKQNFSNSKNVYATKGRILLFQKVMQKKGRNEKKSKGCICNNIPRGPADALDGVGFLLVRPSASPGSRPLVNWCWL